jgi:tape measure domain-containing protein
MAEEEGRISWSAELSDKGFQEGARRMQQEINRITQEVDKSGVAVDRFTDEMDDMADSTRKVKREADDLSSSFGSLTKYAAGFFSLAAAKSFAQKVFDVRSEIQNLQTSFHILVGEKDKADELFNSIKEFATHTPMQLNDLASAAQTMMGFGLPVEQLMENLKALGDISGGDTQRFQSLALAFSQASSAGKLMGQDLMQMINAGFNPLSTMSEKTGKSIAQLKDEMSKGAISADMLRQSLIDATSEGGKFYGMLDAKSKQLGGAYSNLEGAINDMFNEIGEKTQDIMAGSIEAATFIRKGPRPMASDCFATCQSSWNSGRVKCSRRDLSEKKRKV